MVLFPNLPIHNRLIFQDLRALAIRWFSIPKVLTESYISYWF